LDEWWIIIAPGPSLCRCDTMALRGHGRTVAVSCAVFFAPWADVLYAADGAWWRYYGPKLEWYRGKRVSRSYQSKTIQRFRGKGWARTGGNSGHMAIQYAVDNGAKHIALIGFDQQKTNGKAHVHADHPTFEKARVRLSNASGIRAWPAAMVATARDIKQRGVEVVNLSRETALTCFPRVTVEQFLER
jgi:hypothetical protein